MIKKRTLLIPATLMLLSSCQPQANLSNKYTSMNDCLKDNDPTEIQQAMCLSKKVTSDNCEKSYPLSGISKQFECTEIEHEGQKIVIGPEYPSQYYEKVENRSHVSSGTGGFIMGYWLGRSLSGGSSTSSGVFHRASSKSYTHSSFKSAGGSKGLSISRGGFGTSGRGSSLGT